MSSAGENNIDQDQPLSSDVFEPIDFLRRWLFHKSFFEKCADLSPIVCIAVTLFGLSSLIQVHKAPSGMTGLQEGLTFCIAYPFLSLCGCVVALLGIPGKHKKRRIAIFSFLGNLLIPVAMFGLYAFYVKLCHFF
jgi:hypothetical protein